MVLRLILVSLVAGLGCDMPTRHELDTMAQSAQQWVNTRLADWDFQTTSDDESYVLIADPAQTTLPPAAPAPAPVSDNDFAGVLAENVALFAQDELASSTREMDQFVKNGDQLATVDSSKSLAIDLPTAPADMVIDESIPTDITEIAFEGWNQESTESHPGEVVSSTPAHQLDLAFDGVIEETITSFAVDAATLAASTPSPDNDSFETDVRGKAENRLTNAVRLTREAVVAWASLLHGPAVVTIAP
ncbi:hypothetical protein V5E97_37105 [Singulisphaera sp. Ch08]|uniref:Uncharacterized protein n=1 Tax=Singulisphaera sp. Ch08 TaxID=3120278 RepID=A0AAU7CED9_9BACT